MIGAPSVRVLLLEHELPAKAGGFGDDRVDQVTARSRERQMIEARTSPVMTVTGHIGRLLDHQVCTIDGFPGVAAWPVLKIDPGEVSHDPGPSRTRPFDVGDPEFDVVN